MGTGNGTGHDQNEINAIVLGEGFKVLEMPNNRNAAYSSGEALIVDRHEPANPIGTLRVRVHDPRNTPSVMVSNNQQGRISASHVVRTQLSQETPTGANRTED